MGADCHMVREEKIGDKWVGVRVMELNRDYTFFGALAGVRNLDIKHFPPRGIPEDASGTYRDLIEVWGTDGCYHSWLNKEEMKKAVDEAYEHSDRYNELRHVGSYDASLSGSIGQEIVWPSEVGNDIRYCFFFDNP